MFLNANINQNNLCAVLIEEMNELLSSFITFYFSFLFFKRERRKKNGGACVSFRHLYFVK